MRRTIKFVCIILVLALTIPSPVSAAVQDPGVGTQSLYFVAYDSWLSWISNSRFYVCYDVSAKDTMEELGVRSIAIQRSANGTSGWTTMRTYTCDERPEFICENTGSHGGEFVYLATAGYYYRARMLYYAKNSSGTGQFYDNTPVLYLPPHT